MYDETNVPGPEYKVRPVVRYLVTVFYHGYMAKDQHGYPIQIDGSSRVVGEFEREDQAMLVQEAMQKVVDQQHLAMRAEDQPEMVEGDKDAMAEALAAISSDLGCHNNLDDILHAIDAMRRQKAA